MWRSNSATFVIRCRHCLDRAQAMRHLPVAIERSTGQAIATARAPPAIFSCRWRSTASDSASIATQRHTTSSRLASHFRTNRSGAHKSSSESENRSAQQTPDAETPRNAQHQPKPKRQTIEERDAALMQAFNDREGGSASSGSADHWEGAMGSETRKNMFRWVSSLSIRFVNLVLDATLLSLSLSIPKVSYDLAFPT